MNIHSNKPMKTLGAIFLEARKGASLSQKAIADELRCETSYISKIEGGKVLSVSDDLLYRFSEKFGVEVDELNFACGRMPNWMWNHIMEDPVLFRDLCKCDRGSLRRLLPRE